MRRRSARWEVDALGTLGQAGGAVRGLLHATEVADGPQAEAGDGRHVALGQIGQRRRAVEAAAAEAAAVGHHQPPRSRRLEAPSRGMATGRLSVISRLLGGAGGWL
jgi:hypothetical protein